MTQQDQLTKNEAALKRWKTRLRRAFNQVEALEAQQARIRQRMTVQHVIKQSKRPAKPEPEQAAPTPASKPLKKKTELPKPVQPTTVKAPPADPVGDALAAQTLQSGTKVSYVPD